MVNLLCNEIVVTVEFCVLTGTQTHDSPQILTLMILMGEMVFKPKERYVLRD